MIVKIVIRHSKLKKFDSESNILNIVYTESIHNEML